MSKITDVAMEILTENGITHALTGKKVLIYSGDKRFFYYPISGFWNESNGGKVNFGGITSLVEHVKSLPVKNYKNDLDDILSSKFENMNKSELVSIIYKLLDRIGENG